MPPNTQATEPIRHSRIDGPTRPSSSAIVSSTAIHWSRSRDEFIQKKCTYVHIAVKRGSSPEHSEWKSSMPQVRGAEPRQPHRAGHGAVPRRLRGLAGEDVARQCGRGQLEPCLSIGREYHSSTQRGIAARWKQRHVVPGLVSGVRAAGVEIERPGVSKAARASSFARLKPPTPRNRSRVT